MNTISAQTTMTKPLSHFDGRPELRDDAFSNLGLVAHYADLARASLEIADDKATVYFVHCLAAYLKAALGSFNDVLTANAQRMEVGDE